MSDGGPPPSVKVPLLEVLRRTERRSAQQPKAARTCAISGAQGERTDVPFCATPSGRPVNARCVVLCAARARESAVLRVREAGVLIAYVERGGY